MRSASSVLLVVQCHGLAVSPAVFPSTRMCGVPLIFEFTRTRPSPFLTLDGSQDESQDERQESAEPPPLPLDVSPASAAVPASRAGFLATQPLLQLTLCLLAYALHVTVLSRRSLRLGGSSIGLDTLSGLGVLCGVAARRARRGQSAVPGWIYGARAELNPGDASDQLLNLSAAPHAEKVRLLSTGFAMLAAPFVFAFAAPVIEVVIAIVAIFLPLTESGMVATGLLVQQTLLYGVIFKYIGSQHKRFFSSDWIRGGWRRAWLLPVLSGYAASIALFNLVEPLNQALLPHLRTLPEGIVAQIANPADRSTWSLFLGSITPVVGAPLFEEVQSRAFFLQALTALVPLCLALPLMGVLFAAQHMQIGLLMPLSVTGWFWGVTYVSSGNLLVPIFIHALWNLRIFVGSLFGL